MGAVGDDKDYYLPRYKGFPVTLDCPTFIKAKDKLSEEDFNAWKKRVLKKYGKR